MGRVGIQLVATPAQPLAESSNPSRHSGSQEGKIFAYPLEKPSTPVAQIFRIEEKIFVYLGLTRFRPIMTHEDFDNGSL